MKTKIIYISLAFISLLPNVSGQEREGFASFYVGSWDVSIIKHDNLYPTYLADPLAVRFELSRQYMLSSNIDIQDISNTDTDYMGRITVKPSTRLSLLRFSPTNNPKLGIELDMGVALPFTMRKSNFDFLALDGIYFLAISGKPAEWLSLRLAKHHICTHRGVEFWAGSIDTTVDFDPLMFNLYVRDAVVFSLALKPLFFLQNPEWNILQLYGDVSSYVSGEGQLGKRQNKPNTHALYVFQGGLEAEYYFKRTFLGGVFSAVNVSAWQENSYTPNLSIAAGYIFPQAANRRKFRVGINYYDGKSLNNEFFNYRDRFFSLQLVADF